MATFTNQATLTYNNQTFSSNIVTGEYMEVLTATKSATTTSYDGVNTLTYLVSIVNSGSTAVTGLTVTDNLGAYTFTPIGGSALTLTPLTYVTESALYYVNGILQASPTVTEGSPITISGLSVPAGGNALLLYRASPNAYTALTVGSTLTNIATLSDGGIATPITTTNTLAVASEPQLSISKSMSPLTVVENDSLTYTFVIENLGNTAADASANLSVNDTFDPILRNITVTLNGSALAQTGNWNYDITTGVFSTVAGVLTVPAATYTQNPTTGAYEVTPGYTTLTVTGTV